MQCILYSIFILNVCGLIGVAQSPPPPPPLIYKAPQISDFKEFVSDDKTFQIVFPGIPKVTKEEFEKGVAITHHLYRQGSNSVVTTYVFNSEIEWNKEAIYELIKNSYLKAPKSKIEAEKDIQLDGKSGKDFDVLQDYQYQKIRIFIVGKRIFQIKNDVTNWHIINDSTKKLFFEETERFFKTFKIL